MEILWFLWLFIQIVIGFHLVFPALLYGIWLLVRKKNNADKKTSYEPGYAIIVTAYLYTNTLKSVVNSILNLNYQNYVIYVVADNCDISDLNFDDEKVIVLRPESVLASNTKSHAYAIDRFIEAHEFVTIIDSDNLVDPNYIKELNVFFEAGYGAVQGVREAKNLDTTIACLDAARDIYYHFYDGQLLYEAGSSATLAGSGMAFRTKLYQAFLEANDVNGAGFDKVLQSWIIRQDKRIAFARRAVVYDEKTSQSEQLVQQRSRWINTWFKYVKFGFGILLRGLKNFSRNQVLFGMVLLRPPLFIFLFLSGVCFLLNVAFGENIIAGLWVISLALFIAFFLISLKSSDTDPKIYRSLKNIPQFVRYQILSLLKAKNANKISVATKHYHDEETSVNKDHN